MRHHTLRIATPSDGPRRSARGARKPGALHSTHNMWSKKRTVDSPQVRALFAKVRAKGWKTEAEREDLMKQVAAIPGLEAVDVAWMAVEQDPQLKQAGLTLLKRWPFDTAAEALLPLLAQRSDAMRRSTMGALEALAGATFPEKMMGYLEHKDPAVVHAALDFAKKTPSEKYLPGISRALTSPSPSVRRKAFMILEATPSPRVGAIALKILEDDDEDLRYRSVLILAKQPSETYIGPLLKRCQNDSARVQEAAITALTPLLANADERFNAEVLPLLSDNNPKVRQLAVRILQRQKPEKVAEAFLQAFRGTFGMVRERGIEALAAFGPEFIRAFLAHTSSPDPGIAALASSIAVTIRSSEAVPYCIRFLSADDFWMRDRAAQVLADLKDKRALEPLVKMLDDPESCFSAAHSLGVWGTSDVLPGLLAAYKKSDKDLRLEILEAFGNVQDPRIPALLDSIVKADPDPVIKDKAAGLAASRAGTAFSGGRSGAVERHFDPLDFHKVTWPTLNQLLAHARAIGASDLHVSVGTEPHVRVNGVLSPLPLSLTTPAQMESWIKPIVEGKNAQRLAADKQLDFCHKDAELGRFRTNVFRQSKGMNAVFRLIPFQVPSLVDIDLPESLWDLTEYTQGLVLVTGSAGCGKTTTLAALVDRINATQKSHILTIEDPIEYVHTPKEALINQREVPSHTESFAKALRQALREDPDVILVGEMRDLETISLAITASETGHLVLGTLHTTTAASTVDRIINSFPADQQGQIRMMIADSLKAVISQSLLPRRDGEGRIAAFEILRNTSNVTGLIREGKSFQLPTAMQTGANVGMTLMDNSLMQLVQKGLIDPKVAFDRALRKETFEPLLTHEEGSAA
jgi:twitching motility protein PilT